MQPATTATPAPKKARLSVRSLLWIAFLLAFAFFLGYGPKEWERRQVEATLQSTRRDLRLANLHRQLGVATQEAQRNNFGNASAAARTFFDGCRAVLNEYDFEELPRTKTALQVYASTSDTVLLQLANADPAAKDRLSTLYLTMNGLIDRHQ